MIYVNIIGITVLSVFVLFILVKKNKVLSDYLLFLIVFLFFGILITGIIIIQFPTALIYALFLFFNSFIFPSLIIYGLVLLSPNQNFKITWLWTASYAFVFIGFVFADVLFLNEYDNENQVKALIEQPSLIYNILYKGQYLFVIIALIWLLKQIRDYQSKIKAIYSQIDSIHLNWFKNFIYIYLAVNVVSLILFLSLDFGFVKDISMPLLIEHIILILALFYLCFHGIKQYNLLGFDVIRDSDLSNSVSETNYKKYSSSSLSKEEIQMLFYKIEDLFNNEQVYLEPDLKINSIANSLNVNTHKISQTINTMASQRFYDYVNTYRVKHLKNLLSNSENKKFTILALGFESGFNSKATINRVFKQQVGLTPKAFQISKSTI